MIIMIKYHKGNFDLYMDLEKFITLKYNQIYT